MEDEVRIGFEGFIDNFVNEPEKWLLIIEKFLRQFGIESDLDNVLSYISGSAWGQFHMHYQFLEIEVTPKLLSEFMEIMERRSWELRETFIRALHK